MERCVEIARKKGIENVHWSGMVGIEGEDPNLKGLDLLHYYSRKGGCIRRGGRDCGNCSNRNSCRVKKYVPSRST
jgi:hypothetical protein